MGDTTEKMNVVSDGMRRTAASKTVNTHAFDRINQWPIMHTMNTKCTSIISGRSVMNGVATTHTTTAR